MALVTEQNAVRTMAAMAEQTEGLDVNELLLPENYLQEYVDFRPPKVREEDPEEMEIDELTEEDTEEEVVESDEGSNYGDEDGGKKTNRKGKAREKAKKPTKPTNGEKKKPKKPRPAGQVLNELVSFPCSRPHFWFTVP